MYKLIINGKLQPKILKDLDEVIKEISNLDQVKCYSIKWVIA